MVCGSRRWCVEVVGGVYKSYRWCTSRIGGVQVVDGVCIVIDGVYNWYKS